MSCQQHSNPLAYTLQKREIIGNEYRPLMGPLCQSYLSTILNPFHIISPSTGTTMHMYKNACMCIFVHMYACLYGFLCVFPHPVSSCRRTSDTSSRRYIDLVITY